MSHFWIMFTNIVCFIFLHHKTRFIDEYGNGWRQIVSYAVGVLAAFPFFLLHRNKLKETKDAGIIAYLLAFLGSGIGTSFGWMSKDIIND